MSYDAMGNVVSRSATEAAVSGQSGTGGSETQNFCYDEQNRLIWASNNATVPSQATERVAVQAIRAPWEAITPPSMSTPTWANCGKDR